MQNELTATVEPVISAPAPEGYLSCSGCGAILGYWARVGKALFLFAYAHPPLGSCPFTTGRRVYARILEGDVWCCHCDALTEVALNRPWEKK